MGSFNVRCNKLPGLKSSIIAGKTECQRKGARGERRTEKLSVVRVQMLLLLLGTHCKTGEDVCSCPHADADQAVDPTEKPPITVGLEMANQTIFTASIIYINRGSLTSAESSQTAAFQPARPWLGNDTWRRLVRDVSGEDSFSSLCFELIRKYWAHTRFKYLRNITVRLGKELFH